MLFGIPTEAVAKIRDVFAGHPEVEQVILYGSRAKGTFRNGSDVDLAVEGRGMNLTVLNRIDTELDELLLPWSFDLSVYSLIENQDLIDHIKRVGIVVYRQNAEGSGEGSA